jgi:glutamine synthetase
MTPEELRQRVTDGEVDTVVLAFCDHYGRLMGKRIDAEFFVDGLDTGGDLAGTHVCDYLFTVDMEMEPVEGYEFASWSSGYGDVHLVPDLATIRPAAWVRDRPETVGVAWVMCDVAAVDTHEPVSVAPRSVLRRSIDRLAQHGLTAAAGSELEFFVFEQSYRDASRAGYAGLDPAGWYVEDYHLLQGARLEPYVGAVRRALRDSGIPVESSKGEAGHGQHEVNIRYADVLEMADRHALMKHAMKELADSMGISVTFMAKPHDADVGSSSHLHLSLWRDGQNAFAGADGHPTDEFRWFLAGWMAYVDDFMVCYAPTINSYKRYRDLSWAPTRVAWSHDNRTAAFRVVGHADSLRIEFRVPGADVNPYMAYAATLASGLLGIEQRLEPPAEFDGDAYRQPGVDALRRLPASLEHAVVAFAASDAARVSFGADVVEHYTRVHTVEVEAHAAAVTDWERRRYFERI